ncbi:MAG: hypothetical protein HC866_22635 [Leptolyngbyaceae cyanobacterium RU_5_1]|nr:hypothetical protein [Leptolyngbyaceae cyanobacterium RU_5_1]
MVFFQTLKALSLGQVSIPDPTAALNGSIARVTSEYENFDQVARLEQGITPAGQIYRDWVIRTADGLLQDAYVRDNCKLGVVIGIQVHSYDIHPLAKYLADGFQKSFPNRNLKVLVYDCDKRLILTASHNLYTCKLDYW